MLGSAAGASDASLWAIALPSLLAMLLVSVYKGWQYLLEQQRQQFVERVLQKLPPDGSVEVGAGQISVCVCGSPTSTDEQGLPSRQAGEPAAPDIIALETHKQSHRSRNGQGLSSSARPSLKSLRVVRC
jgi:hypothetical protein